MIKRKRGLGKRKKERKQGGKKDKTQDVIVLQDDNA
jgi:hypothetical protein